MATESPNTIEVNGEERELDNIRFVQKRGTELTVALPEKTIPAKTPDGEDIVYKKGGQKITFRNGIYPPTDQTIEKEVAEIMLDHDHYGKLFVLAAEEQETPTSDEIREQMEASLSENEVMVDGQVMTQAEALDYLKKNGADTDEEETATSEFETEAKADQASGQVYQGGLTDLDATNRSGALEMLAQQGVNMENAPPASATTSKIQEFAVDNGYNIPKYDLPETE
jgi:hypothetical protein